MKILNKVICLITFFAAGESFALIVRGTPNQPAPAPQQPGQKATYKQLHDTILAQTPAAVKMFDGNKFSDSYLTQAIASAKDAEISSEGLKALLQTARDKWISFTGNDADDLGILKAVNQQIDDAVAQM